MTGETTMQAKILDRAQDLIQMRGYNGFSFRDIATDIGIKSSSIHYYYPSKTHLAIAVTSKYRSDFKNITTELRAGKKTATTILENYAALFQATVKRDKRICLAAMLASELNSVDPEVRVEIKAFFIEQHEVLTEVVLQGQSDGEIRAGLNASDFAKAYLAALEGAMMLARTDESSSDINLVSRQMITMIKST